MTYEQINGVTYERTADGRLRLASSPTVREPRTPQTKAGRALYGSIVDNESPDDWPPLAAKMILAIESEAAQPIDPPHDCVAVEADVERLTALAEAVQPIDVERLTEALRASPSLLLEGDDKDRAVFAAHIAAEYARLSGEE